MFFDTVVELVLGISGFASTNIENVVILVGVFCAKIGNTNVVRLGFAIGAIAILVISLMFIVIGEFLPIRYLGYLGIIPILFGIRELVAFQSTGEVAEQRSKPVPQGLMQATLSASSLMVASGADTIAVFAPLLAETKTMGIFVISLGYTTAGLALAALSGYACTHPGIAKPLRRYGPKIAPYIMIGIGVYILFNTATDTLPG